MIIYLAVKVGLSGITQLKSILTEFDDKSDTVKVVKLAFEKLFTPSVSPNPIEYKDVLLIFINLLESFIILLVFPPTLKVES